MNFMLGWKLFSLLVNAVREWMSFSQMTRMSSIYLSQMVGVGRPAVRSSWTKFSLRP